MCAVLSHSVVSDSFWSHNYIPPGSSLHEDSPGKCTGVGCCALIQGIFPIQGLNPVVPYCRQIICHLSHQRSPRILGWVAYPFSRRSSQPRNWTEISCIEGRFHTSWTTREAIIKTNKNWKFCLNDKQSIWPKAVSISCWYYCTEKDLSYLQWIWNSSYIWAHIWIFA